MTIPEDTSPGLYQIRVGRFEDEELFGCSGTFEILSEDDFDLSMFFSPEDEFGLSMSMSFGSGDEFDASESFSFEFGYDDDFYLF